MELLRDAGSALAELIWPTRCAGCGVSGTVLCESCSADDIQLIDPTYACPICGAASGRIACTECPSRVVELPTCNISAALYVDPLKRAIVTFKEYDELRLAPLFADEMARAFRVARAESASPEARSRLRTIDAITHIPASDEAYRRRGYDHMELIAEFLAATLDLPHLDALVRVIGRTQKRLGREARGLLAQKTFATVEDVSGRRVLLVDDVHTTGTTLDHGARILLDAGAADVVGMTLARVM